MVKKYLALILALIVISVSAITANASVELTEIDDPYGIVYKVYDDSVAERVSISCIFTDDYAAMTGMTNEESQKKYGFINASTYVQIDYRIDGGEWQADEIWETTPNAAQYGGNVPAGDTVRTFDLLYLINEIDIKNAGALAKKDDKGRNVFDLDNHTLEFRIRTTMTFTDRIAQVITSEWSDTIKVERNKDFGEAPTDLEAPELYDARIAYLDDEMPYLAFELKTPESIKEAEAWFSTQEPTYVTLLVELDRGDGAWESVNLSVSAGHYVNETKAIYLTASDVEDVSEMKVRARYVTYLEDKTLYSDYSDVLEFSVPRWVEGKGIMHAKCKVCGICYPIFGQCMFVIGGIALLVAVVVAVPVKMNLDKKKAKKAAEEEERQRKLEEERRAYDKAKKDKKNKNKKG
ncbi:MAG: hypothetical protein IJA87_08320 [Clostridia bacterium]|nr:hypothetical protein [Clostridia bacterium]